MGLLETDDSIQEDKPASSKKEEISGHGKKGGPRPLETPYQKESSDFAPKVKINLNYRPGLVSKWVTWIFDKGGIPVNLYWSLLVGAYRLYQSLN